MCHAWRRIGRQHKAPAGHDLQGGIDRLPNLRILFISNNKIKDWSEVERLSGNVKLEELLLMGNPLTPATGTSEYRTEANTIYSNLATSCSVLICCSLECQSEASTPC